MEAHIHVDGWAHTEAQMFAAAAASYLADGLHHLAPTTREDREGMLSAEGPLVATFGTMSLATIRRKYLLDWWAEFVEGGGRSAKTGRNYLDALSGVFVCAQERELLD